MASWLAPADKVTDRRPLLMVEPRIVMVLEFKPVLKELISSLIPPPSAVVRSFCCYCFCLLGFPMVPPWDLG